MVANQKAGDNRTIVVSDCLEDSVETIRLSKKAGLQLEKLRKIFNPTTTGNPKTNIMFRTYKYKNVGTDVMVCLYPLSKGISQSAGQANDGVSALKDYLLFDRRSSKNLGKNFSRVVGELYDKIMDADIVILFDCWNQQQEPKTVFVIKDEQLQLG